MPADTTLRAADSPDALPDKDSIYYSKERWRLIPQRTGPLTIQYLVIDTYENEIVGTHTKRSSPRLKIWAANSTRSRYSRC